MCLNWQLQANIKKTSQDIIVIYKIYANNTGKKSRANQKSKTRNNSDEITTATGKKCTFNAQNVEKLELYPLWNSFCMRVVCASFYRTRAYKCIDGVERQLQKSWQCLSMYQWALGHTHQQIYCVTSFPFTLALYLYRHRNM